MTSCGHTKWMIIDRTKDLVYFLGAAELLSVEILVLISHFPPEALIFVCSQRLFCTASCLLGHVFYLSSGNMRLSISRRFKMYSVLFLWLNQ